MIGGASFTSTFPEVLAKFGAELQSTLPELKNGLRASLRGTARIFAADAKSSAGWSTRIPATFQITEGGESVLVSAGDDRGEAAAFEHGGKGGTFRHPVFGRRTVWVTQGARPFFGPAFLRATPDIETQMGRISDAVFLRIGYR